MTHRTILLFLLVICVPPAHAFNAAFFYGTPFIPELRIYDAIIVEPDQPDFASVPANLQNKLYAYTSLGEVGADKPYAKDVPAAAKLTRNPAWSSDVMDQTSQTWQQFYVNKIVAPLWAKGFRGIFIDTLDSYQLAATTPASRADQEAGMVATLRQLKIRFPGIRIILNRGFEILPQIHADITAVAAESLFQGWDNAKKHYTAVSENDRSWLTAQLNRVKNEYHLPVIVIDYAEPRQRTQARQLAQQIRAAGFSPWVSNPELDMLGIGSPEIQPRRVLMLYDGRENKDPIYSDIHRFAAMPVQHMGYIPEYHDLSLPLPAQQLAGQYAGIILWSGTAENSVPQLKPWLFKQIRLGIRLAVINEFGFERSRDNLQAFGLTVKDSVAADKVSIIKQDAIVGFEHSPQPHPNNIDIIQAGKDSTPILQLRVGEQITDVAAYMPWGGYVLSPYAVYEVPYQQATRWIINPFSFFKRALGLPDMPAPDVTT
ncbi:MAG: endo alpha-1,4 polygalactosaminidase, partial [Sulfuriferula sp.]